MNGPAVRTRFAPSPTGRLHIGSVRTALFNRLYAMSTGGRFILRIEDTDLERSSSEFEKGIFEDLKWLGLGWDEGPGAGGEKGPYRQSERLAAYRRHAVTLVEKGLAYRCYCSRERLEALKDSQLKAGLPPRYDGRCRDISAAPEGVIPAIRFKVPDAPVSFPDMVHGAVSFEAKDIGDFVIIGSDGIASYNFAVVVDDALMGITHIIRGDDHISNTPRQTLLFSALGFEHPVYAHIPLVLGTGRTPLSKRDEGMTVRALRDGGYMAEAIINSTARLGWSPPAEGLLTLEEMAGAFSTDRLSKSPSVFDMDRLRHFNKLAIGKAGADEILERVSAPPGADRARLAEIIDAVKANAVTLREVEALIVPFTGEPEFTKEARGLLDEPYAKAVLKAFRLAAEKRDILDEAACGAVISEVKGSTREKGARLFMPIRAALTGNTEGIELAKILRLLGKRGVASRLERFEG